MKDICTFIKKFWELHSTPVYFLNICSGGDYYRIDLTKNYKVINLNKKTIGYCRVSSHNKMI